MLMNRSSSSGLNCKYKCGQECPDLGVTHHIPNFVACGMADDSHDIL